MKRKLRSKADDVQQQTFKTGDLVMARWTDFKYYTAIVCESNGKSVTVKFTEDKVVLTLKDHLIKTISKNEYGSGEKKDIRKVRESSKKKINDTEKIKDVSKGRKTDSTERKTDTEEITDSRMEANVAEDSIEKNAYNTEETIDSVERKTDMHENTKDAHKKKTYSIKEIDCTQKIIDGTEEIGNDTANNIPRNTHISDKRHEHSLSPISEDKFLSSESEYIPSSDDENSNEFLFRDNPNINQFGNTSCKKPKLTNKIEVIYTKNEKGKRKWDKKYHCLYCERPFSKLPRHLEKAHSEESEVSNLIALKNGKSNSKQRNAILCKIRNMGNHRHNCNVLRKGEGKLFVVYRPKKPVNPSNYVPCVTCYGYYAKKELWKHACPLTERGKKTTTRVVAAGRNLMPTPEYIDVNIKELVNSMRQDSISNIIRSDKTICEFMRRMFFSKGGHENHRKNEIRSNSRELARLLEQLRKRKGRESCTVLSCIDPSEYKDIVNAVRCVAGYDEISQKYKAPELARKLGMHIKSCAMIVSGIALEENNTHLLQRAENFIKLHNLNFFTEIGAQVRRVQCETKRLQQKLIPLSEDVVKLTNYLKRTIEESINFLENISTMKSKKIAAWVLLQKATLTQIMVFNRRREGEVSRIEITDFKNKKSADDRSDIEKELNAREKALCKILTRIEIRGKCNRNVPVLLTPNITAALEIALKWRDFVGINKKNTYLFARCNYRAKLHYRGSECIRQFSLEAGLKCPKSMTSTRLRKHVASLSQILNLKENELDSLASFMGHDIRIHREYYRLPDSIIQVAKLSKLFIALEKGNLQKNSGKSLEEIEVSLEEDIEEDELDTEVENSEEEIEWDVQTSAISEEILPSTSESANNDKPCSRRMWSQEEKFAVEKHLGIYILRGKLPGADIIRQCISSEIVLKNRSWKKIKDYCRNKILTSNKKIAKK